jgi:hypothetical protein
MVILFTIYISLRKLCIFSKNKGLVMSLTDSVIEHLPSMHKTPCSIFSILEDGGVEAVLGNTNI